MKFFNILVNAFKKNNYLIILKKFLSRFEKDQTKLALEWTKNQVSCSIDEWMQKTDYQLYLETKKECKIIEYDAQKIISKSLFWQTLTEEKVAGGAAYELLYFITKKRKSNIIVETGVAAGWSSLAFLRASKNNDSIKIFSSDFPYFRKKYPEKYIGMLVKNEPNLKNLDLFIEGDEINIPIIAKKLKNDKIDLFHYDSDKSYVGRNFCLKFLKPYFSKNAILIFDDIHNNFHFKDFVENNNLKYTVISHPNYVGMIDLSDQL
ncbi:class I SAM-dependent methyltransferase [Candidatus Pelagibacter bacterium]|nr:class I SAM-dependent methyltransferase [Candidatus Pelagibacter bacterium]MDA8836194.1 class I SAM-dependent methyltransferase [Candidatus Pelagibacter bacterium]